MATICKSIMLPAVVIASVSCAADRADPMASSGMFSDGTVPGLNALPNATVEYDQRFEVMQSIGTLLISAVKRANQAVAVTTGGKPDNLRIMGYYNGYATANGSVILQEDNDTLRYSLKLGMFAYSETGKLFLDGGVDCSGYFAPDNDGQFRMGTVCILGALSFKGDYRGTLHYRDLKVPIDKSDNPVDPRNKELIPSYFYPHGDVMLESGEHAYSFIPYF